MKVLFATSEIAPWVKTGGLGDVAAALPPALRAAGVDVRVLVPLYPALRDAFPEAPVVASLDGFGAHYSPSTLREATAPDGTLLWMLDTPAYFDRPGNPYLGPEGHDWLDNHLRFGQLSRIAAWLGSVENFLDWRPEVIHCNDWQTALAPAYLNLLPGGRARSLITVHNLAFQGLFPASLLPALALPPQAYSINGVEFHGEIGFLKAGLVLADWITTVSPTYAAEIRTREYGMGLDGLLRSRTERLSGILNGIDDTVWNPSRDPLIAARFDARRIAPRIANKSVLKKRMNLAPDDALLFGVVSRLTWQKGLDMLVEVLPTLPEIVAELMATHPPMSMRVARLKAMAFQGAKASGDTMPIQQS